MSFDLVVRNGRLVDESGVTEADVGIRDGRVVAAGPGLEQGRADIDAGGRYVLPGGVDSHVHLGQVSSQGDVTADDFWTGSRAAAHGGTTTVVPFAAQHRGMSIREVVGDALERARAQMAVDYGLHLIVTDWSGTAPAELAEAAAGGVAAVKIYLTYDRLKVDGATALEVMEHARRAGLAVMVHAEDDAIVGWGRERRVAAGELGPGSHAFSHSRAAEWAGVAQAIALAETAEASLYLAHISTPAAFDLVAAARRRGVDVVAETCPHYLVLAEDRTQGSMEEAAPFLCSPPLRSDGDRLGLLERLADGRIDLVASDHSPYTMEQKLPEGAATPFTAVANGLPGVELRLALLYSAAVSDGGLAVTDVVRLTASNPARVCGFYPRKGTLRVGADADLAVWEEEEWTVRWADLHDNVGYTPYRGMRLAGRPAVVVSRGEVIVAAGVDAVAPGRGRYMRRG